jgi:hypothetical protein
MAEFKREFRYAVIKRKDADAALTLDERATLSDLLWKIECWRQRSGKGTLSCVVVEHDWPEYEPTWKAIEARMAPGGAEEKPND